MSKKVSHNIKLSQEVNTKIGNEKVFTVKFSPDNAHLAAACGDGSIEIFDTFGHTRHKLDVGGLEGDTPLCVNWRPHRPASFDALMTATSGTIYEWNVNTEQITQTITEDDNNIYAIDYSSDSKRFCSAGRDRKVRVYDDLTKKITHTLGTGGSRTKVGHSNRVYALKFFTEDEPLLISGGWDKCVFVWDLRSGEVARHVYGPFIAGDAVDVSDGRILTASHKSENPIQLWDLGTAKLIKDVDYYSPPDMMVTKFHPSGDQIIAAGACAGKVFDLTSYPYQPIERVTLEEGIIIYHADFSPSGHMLAVAGACNKINIYGLH